VPRPAPRAMRQSEVVAREIFSGIVSSNLPEGTRLPNEKAMLEQYQVGRSTLREALRILESRGVLSVRSGRDGGPVVRRPRAADLGEALTVLLQFEKVPFTEVFAARQALEPTLAALAARNVKKATLRSMRECVDRMSAHIDESVVFHAENLRFHGLIASASGSSVLELLERALESVAGGMAFGAVGDTFSSAQRQMAVQWHERLYEALAAHDEQAARDAMEKHLYEAQKHWLAGYRDLARRPIQWTPTADSAGPLPCI
jgi:DNA-binding FadR family transcriptional regulator